MTHSNSLVIKDRCFVEHVSAFSSAIQGEFRASVLVMPKEDHRPAQEYFKNLFESLDNPDGVPLHQALDIYLATIKQAQVGPDSYRFEIAAKSLGDAIKRRIDSFPDLSAYLAL